MEVCLTNFALEMFYVFRWPTNLQINYLLLIDFIRLQICRVCLNRQLILQSTEYSNLLSFLRKVFSLKCEA